MKLSFFDEVKSRFEPSDTIREAALSTVGGREVGGVLPTLLVHSARRRVVYQPVSCLETVQFCAVSIQNKTKFAHSPIANELWVA